MLDAKDPKMNVHVVYFQIYFQNTKIKKKSKHLI